MEKDSSILMHFVVYDLIMISLEGVCVGSFGGGVWGRGDAPH